MGANSSIEWTHHTFNPWRGCTKVSTGCAHCYAETLSHRNAGTLGVWGPKGTRVVAAEATWREPLKWDTAAAAAGERHRVFCASLADVFEDWRGRMSDSHFDTLFSIGGKWTSNALPDEQPVTMDDVRRRLFALIDSTPNLDWLLLTKRPENIGRMLPPRDLGERDEAIAEGDYGYYSDPDHAFRRPNVWIGTSVENQDAANERIPHLLQAPAAVRFLSVEPLLGPVDFSRWLLIRWQCSGCNGYFSGPLQTVCPDCGKEGYWTGSHAFNGRGLPKRPIFPHQDGHGIDWVIVGGESGPGARPCRVEWVRSIVQHCKVAGVACFVKQLGSNPDGNELWQPTGRLRRDKAGNLKAIQLARTIIDRKGGDPAEWPADLRVREFPSATKGVDQ